MNIRESHFNKSNGSADDAVRDAATEVIDIKSALIKSAAAHLILVLVLTVRAYIFPSEPLKLESAIRVDIVGLPEKSATLPPPIEVPEPEAAPPSPPPPAKELPPVVKEAPKKTEPVVLKPTKPDPKQQKKDQTAALKRLEAFERLDRQARAEAAKKALDSLKNARDGQAAVRGNQLSKGNSLSGLTRLDHAKYLDDVEARVKSQWRPPKFLTGQKLRVRVIVLIDELGVIQKKSIVQSSGNSLFDETALAAIDSAQPLSPPPESLQSILANQGVELDLEPSGFR